MNTTLEFEPSLSNFLDDNTSNASGNSDAKKKLKSICGKKPLLGKKKKAAYQKCVDANAETGVDITSKVETGTDITSAVKAAENKAETTPVTTSTTSTTTTTSSNPPVTPADDASDDEGSGNIMGMSPILFYGGLLAVGVIGFFTVRHFMKKGHATT